MDHYPTATYTFSKEELPVIKMKMLNWLRPFSIFSYFDNNRYEHAPNRFELLVGAGAHQTLRELPSASDNWWMGHLNYDYKNKLNKSLLSRHTAQTGFEDVFFYQPENLVYIPFQEDKLVVSCVKGNPQL